MSGEWDGLRAAAEAAPKIWLWYGGFISAAEPAVVLRVLDRLQAAEAAVERVRAASESRRELSGDHLRRANDAKEAGNDAKAEWHTKRAGMFFAHSMILDEPLREVAGSPQEATGADLSASGAESDHGGRRDGEGLA